MPVITWYSEIRLTRNCACVIRFKDEQTDQFTTKSQLKKKGLNPLAYLLTYRILNTGKCSQENTEINRLLRQPSLWCIQNNASTMLTMHSRRLRWWHQLACCTRWSEWWPMTPLKPPVCIAPFSQQVHAERCSSWLVGWLIIIIYSALEWPITEEALYSKPRRRNCMDSRTSENLQFSFSLCGCFITDGRQ